MKEHVAVDNDVTVVGRGLLGRAFSAARGFAPGTVVFASGVSNSSTVEAAAFERESTLLRRWMDTSHGNLVYFSSCGLASGESAHSKYMRHKRDMEAIVLQGDRSRVFRLPQVVGYTDNPYTLINYLRQHIVECTPFEVWSKAERNLIDIDDVVAIVTEMVRDPREQPRVVNVAGLRSTPMPEIVRLLERSLGRKANFTLVAKGEPMTLDTRHTAEVARRLGLDLGETYPGRVIARYCASVALPPC
ncbi:NAD-dependent epimerase/dehydratase family protein [Luteibacter sp. SG786]|uniref:NAD-dependent epimerase/dehydratase family protein n=1 Tax=Luteibacter sp. SG786 TaxID=2587130 RepID=UPI00141E0688|nr:NAD-dependent epimerase/dehydratase family protein [Luteibacter sp. SG786]NII56424.1 nucleoside-diphosphate-sugar epimerase [Luteibacter sp. SG786]